MTTQQLDRQYVAHTYNRFPLEITGGKGSTVYGADGREYIDLGSGIAVNIFGLGDEQWQSAVTRQLSKVQHTSNLFYCAPVAQLAQMLCERTGMSKVFFSNSGAEANECAVKAARKWGCTHKGAEHDNIITLKQSFHGRTIAMLAATGQDHYHEQFQPLPAWRWCGRVSVSPLCFPHSIAQPWRKYNICSIIFILLHGKSAGEW